MVGIYNGSRFTGMIAKDEKTAKAYLQERFPHRIIEFDFDFIELTIVEPVGKLVDKPASHALTEEEKEIIRQFCARIF